MTKMNEHAEKIVKYYNKYDGTNPEVLNEFYTDDVVFEDPVTKLHGREYVLNLQIFFIKVLFMVHHGSFILP
jgi:hypothetical protein